MSMMRYKFDTAAAYGLEAGVVGHLLATTKTSDAISMNLDAGTLVADWVGARVSFTVTPGGNTDDTLRCAVLLCGNGTNYTVAPAGTVYEGGMLPGSMGVITAGVTTAEDVGNHFAPVGIMNFYIRNRHTGAAATVSQVAFSVRIVPAAVAMKLHFYKSAGETAANTFTLSNVSIQRFRQAIGDF